MISPSQHENRITTEYDEQFNAVKDLKWDPWVGVDYHKHRILIIGRSTHYEDSDGNLSLEWKKNCDTRRDPSRSLVVENYEDKPFLRTSRMFIEGAEKKYSKATSDMFWNSVAFNNHCQKIVRKLSDPCEDMMQANHAFKATLAILKPKLCLVWTTQIWKVGFNDSEYRECRPKIKGALPRVVDDQESPVVGIKHPSRWVYPNAGDEKIKEACGEWREFLITDPASKKPVTKFIEYLHNHPTK